jgi:hypothetical protein
MPHQIAMDVAKLFRELPVTDAEIETASDALQRTLERPLACVGRERGTTMIATKRNEMALSGFLKPFQTQGTRAAYAQKRPTQAKTRLEWATSPVVGLADYTHWRSYDRRIVTSAVARGVLKLRVA